MTEASVILTGKDLTLEEVHAIARERARVVIAPEAEEAMRASRAFVEAAIAEGKIIYGVTTGFGHFKHIVISPEQTEELQVNLIRSHATGVGAPLPEDMVRAALVVRLNSLLRGHSGIRNEVVHALRDVLNHDVYPYVPSKGSVGSSGDLAPLSHMMLVLMGEGEVLVEGRRVPSAQVLAEKGLRPVTLRAKEGLALNNGTSVQTGIGALAVYDALQLARVADIAYALSLEVLMGTLTACDARIHALRPHRGQSVVAQNTRALCADSEIMASHKDCGRVQDAYSLRCAPQVQGASRDTIAYARSVVTCELNSVTDNPLIFAADGDVLSAGHFHGEPIAQVMDFLKIGVCELGNISERRTARLIDPALSEGLPAFLIGKAQAGISSGLMIPQYVAAALVSENKVLAHPASVDSIPTSANQEDHVSMGTIAARQAYEIVQNVHNVLVIELLSAAQAVEFRKPLQLGKGTRAAYALIREHVDALEKDRILYHDLEKLTALGTHALIARVEEAMGERML